MSLLLLLLLLLTYLNNAEHLFETDTKKSGKNLLVASQRRPRRRARQVGLLVQGGQRKSESSAGYEIAFLAFKVKFPQAQLPLTPSKGWCGRSVSDQVPRLGKPGQDSLHVWSPDILQFTKFFLSTPRFFEEIFTFF